MHLDYFDASAFVFVIDNKIKEFFSNDNLKNESNDKKECENSNNKRIMFIQKSKQYYDKAKESFTL